MIGHRSLPPGLIDKCMDVLKEISPDERELIRVVVETVIDLRDNDDEAEIPPDGQSFLVRAFFATETTSRLNIPLHTRILI